jgi:hypothetical protein
MSQQSATVLERLLQNNGLGGLIEVSRLLEQLERVELEYRKRIGVTVPFSPEALESEAAQNPHKVRAFLQAMRASRSPEMLVMVWRILQGLSIRHVEVKYREQEEFRLTVILALPEGAQDPPYQSRDIFDVRLLPHFGCSTIGDKPLFEGFYPFPVRDDRR